MLFISYSRQNFEIAKLLHCQLIAAEYAASQVFKDDDQRNGISLGNDWEKELIANIRGVTVLIVLVSPAWLESKWCFAELTMAKASHHNVKIIPFVVADLTAEQWLASGLTARQKSNVEFSSYANAEAAITAFLEDLQARGILSGNPNQRLRDSYPDSSSYQHKSYEQWGTDPNMRHSLVPDTGHQTAIDAIRANLQDNAAFHLHVHGNTGIGKSRIVFEALSLAKFQTRVVYYDSPDQFIHDPYVCSLLRPDAADQAIVVVDDCLRIRPSELANRLRPASGRVKLITVSFDTPDPNNGINIEVPAITDHGIQKIIESFCGPTFNATSIAKLCQGSARYAHLVGEAAKNDRSILDTQDGRDLAERIIPCGASKDSELAKSRLIVARFLALFDRFGAVHPHADEIQSIATMIRRFHPRIGLGEVLDTVQALHRARILQGRSTYFFSTPLISHELWGAWWRMYGEHWSIAKPMSLPEYLFDAWLHQMRTVQSSVITRKVAKRILQSLEMAPVALLSGHQFGDPNVGTKVGEDRYRSLIQAIGDLIPNEIIVVLHRELKRAAYDPTKLSEAREHLQGYERIIHECARERNPSLASFELLTEIELGHIIDEAEQAAQAGKTLGAVFARCRGETRVNQTFQMLINYLRERIELGTEEYRFVVLMAVYHAIQKTSDHTHEGKAYIDQLWKLGATGFVKNLGISNYEAILEQLAECLQLLFAFPDKANEWIGNLGWLAQTTPSHRILILSAIESIWTHPQSFFEKESVRDALKRFYNLLIECDVSTRAELLLLRDIRAFSPDDEAKLQSLFPHRTTMDEICKAIATSPHANSELIAKLIRSTNSWFFAGERIQLHDQDGQAFQCILKDYESNLDATNIRLIVGYLNALKKSNLPLYESYFQATDAINWSNQNRLQLCANLNARNDRIAESLLALAKESNTNMRQLWYISDEQVRALSQEKFREIVVSFLNSKTIRGLESATWLFHTRCPTEDALTDEAKSLLEMIVLSETVFGKLGSMNCDNLDLQYWNECFKLQATCNFEVCSKFLATFWQHDMLGLPGPTTAATNGAVNYCFAHFPDSTWDVFFTRLKDAEKTEAVRLLEWISNRRRAKIEPHAGYWGSIPIESLFSWADESPSVRIPLIARHIPTPFLASGIFEPTRRFLLRYNDRFPDVETQIRDRSFGYVVPSTEQVQTRLLHAVQERDAEQNAVMVAILDREIEFLSTKLERTKENEELRMERDRFR